MRKKSHNICKNVSVFQKMADTFKIFWAGLLTKFYNPLSLTFSIKKFRKKYHFCFLNYDLDDSFFTTGKISCRICKKVRFTDVPWI